MGLLRTTAAALALLGSTLAAPTELAERSSTAKVCDSTTKICFTEYVSTNSISFRVAIPDSAAAGKPFDVMLSMTAPKAIGWAGIAWGGAMANNPLTLGWANGDKAVVSSRRATGHTMPTVYDTAKYQLISGVSNATHWNIDVLCTGCSSWDAAGKTVNLDPTSAAQKFCLRQLCQRPCNARGPR